MLTRARSMRNGEPHYTVFGPGVIHPEHKYTVAVSVHNTAKPCVLIIGIEGPSYSDYKIVKLSSDVEVKLVDFDIPDLKQDTYKLIAKGISGIEFAETKDLVFERFDPYTIIQTDKGAYKPGDVLQFRVLFLDENYKPSTVKKTTFVYIEDSKRSCVKEFRNLDLVTGVYTGRFQISESAVLGTWRIKVQLNVKESDNNHNCFYCRNNEVNFEVENYVLPKYVVKAEATANVSVLDGDLQIMVKAYYTHGKPVNGKTTLYMKIDSSDNIPHIIKSKDMIRGRTKFDFNIKGYKNLIDKQHTSILKIFATVEEEFTGAKINTETQSTLYPYRYNIRSLLTCSTYHPDREHQEIYEIRYIDNSQIKDTKSVVRLIYTEIISENWNCNGESVPNVELPNKMKSFIFESNLNRQSRAIFQVKLPDLNDIDGHVHKFSTQIEFKNQKNKMNDKYPYRIPKETSFKLSPVRKRPNEYLRISPMYEEEDKMNPRYEFEVDKEAMFLVNSDEPFKYFVYIIVGRGNILNIERVELAYPADTYELKIFPTSLMCPDATVYMHYVENGRYFYAEKNFGVRYKCENHIDISVPAQVHVGENVPIQIRTIPNSFVGLLAVDLSVLLHKQNNDVKCKNLQFKFNNYQTRIPSSMDFNVSEPGSNSGVFTLTKAEIIEQPLRITGGGGGYTRYSSDSADLKFEHVNPVVRSNFAETWIFHNVKNTKSGNITWHKKIPDTITSWVISGFSMNSEKGIASTRSLVKTFQPFFVSITLPYSVKRGEVISVTALVSNYLKNDLAVKVTLDNTDDEYEFINAANGVINVPSRTKIVHIPANSAKGVSYVIRPKIIGNIMLKFKAVSALVGDAIHKTMKVIPEGITEYANRAFFVNLKENAIFKETFQIDYPDEIVPDSEHAEFAVVGDLLGPMFKNLNSLVRMPTGCGEQTMSTFIPNYLALRYLVSTDRLTAELERRIKNNLEQGYQHMLSFRHDDGSFSCFGPRTTVWDNKPIEGSTWLTAYVVRFLQQAKEYIPLDINVITKGLDYMKQRQASNGSFPEGGTYFYGSQSDDVSQTSSVLLAFLVHDNQSLYSDEINKGINFILENIEKTSSLCAKALAVFALTQAKHELATKHLNDLKKIAKSDSYRTWWTEQDEATKKRRFFRWWCRIRSDEVETTSYALLSLLHENPESMDSILPIVKWLVSQRNSYGGFSSTQDTVVGLQALIKFAEMSGYVPGEMHINFVAGGKSDELDVNPMNAILLQSHELPVKARSLEFEAKGRGAALVQVSYQYNLVETEKSPSFKLNTEVRKDTPALKLELDVMVEYVGAGKRSNMALLEVSLPSGYVADEDNVEKLRKADGVRHIELQKSGTNIVLYYDSLEKEKPKNLTIEALKNFAVALQKPAPVVVYDYYDTTKKATAYYEVSSKLLDICDKDEKKLHTK